MLVCFCCWLIGSLVRWTVRWLAGCFLSLMVALFFGCILSLFLVSRLVNWLVGLFVG